MSELTNAEKYAKIAKAVWTDALILTHVWEPSDLVPFPFDDYVTIESGHKVHTFNLLATNPDGTPTTQAKADALDVLVWLLNSNTYELIAFIGNPCETIFNAAWEVVKDE